ncbi:MAG: hypothetical protein H6733_08440 [Alphaproteobacteria bacterium]|nr:hypothetical protein [Alphaproteobacteria bacterium]
MSSDVFGVEPDPGLWRDELLEPAFFRLPRLLEDRDSFANLAREATKAGHVVRSRDRKVRSGSDELTVLKHYFLLSEFVRAKKGAAVADVVRADLPAYELPAGKRPNRLHLAALLYEKDPRSLVSVQVMDIWHSRRRSTWKLAGKHPHFVTAKVVDWFGVTGSCLASLAASNPRQWSGVALKVVVERGERGVVLGMRRPGRTRTGRGDDGAGVSTHDDDWIILRFFRGGWNLDVTASDPDAGARLASLIAGRVLGSADVAYHRLSDRVKPEQLGDLFARLVDPENKDFPLVEVVWTDQAENTYTVTNVGTTVVEPAVIAVQGPGALSSWEQLRSAKMLFQDKYRMQVHFPGRGGDRVLTYSDLDRPKDVAESFEEYLLEKLDIPVRPKEGARRRQAGSAIVAHAAGSVAELRRLLAPVVEDVSDDELRRLHELHQDGLVKYTVVDWFRCSEASGIGGEDSTDCDAVIEVLDGDDGDDVGATEADGLVECPGCHRHWRPRAGGIDVRRRARVEVKRRGAWNYIARRLAGAGFEEKGRGVLYGLHDGVPALLICEPDAGADWLAMRTDVMRRVCHVHEQDFEPDGSCDVPLVAMIADPTTLSRQALSLTRDVKSSRLGTAGTPTPRRTRRQPVGKAVHFDERGVSVGGVTVGAKMKAAIDYLRGLVLLREDAVRASRATRLATDEDVARRLDKVMKESALPRWGNKARNYLERELTPEFLWTILERGPGGVGVRLRSDVSVSGLVWQAPRPK